jgi:hypothetical protein
MPPGGSVIVAMPRQSNSYENRSNLAVPVLPIAAKSEFCRYLALPNDYLVSLPFEVRRSP